MKRLLFIALIVLMTVALAACGGNNDSKNVNNNDQTNHSQNNAGDASSNDSNAGDTDSGADQANKATEYPLSVTDATGLEITFTKAPERIVSTSPSETEILFALGLGDRIYGVSDYDNYPEQALSKPKIGGIVTPNEEAIIAAEPDLVISGISMKSDVADKLRSLGLVLYKTDASKLEDVLNNILRIGVITDTQVKAEELVAGMREDIRKVTEAAGTLQDSDKKKVYIEFAPGWTVGKGEFMDELITMAGALNIASSIEGWSPVNEEMIIQENPDVILFAADMVDYETGKPLQELITARSGWDQVEAIKNNQLFGLNEDIMSRTGPRLTQGLLDVAEAVYPGLVKK